MGRYWDTSRVLHNLRKEFRAEGERVLKNPHLRRVIYTTKVAGQKVLLQLSHAPVAKGLIRVQMDDKGVHLGFLMKNDQENASHVEHGRTYDGIASILETYQGLLTELDVVDRMCSRQKDFMTSLRETGCEVRTVAPGFEMNVRIPQGGRFTRFKLFWGKATMRPRAYQRLVGTAHKIFEGNGFQLPENVTQTAALGTAVVYWEEVELDICCRLTWPYNTAQWYTLVRPDNLPRLDQILGCIRVLQLVEVFRSLDRGRELTRPTGVAMTKSVNALEDEARAVGWKLRDGTAWY